jgi:N-acetyl-anhydromuramyl-L-alanine amidase AmpD
MKIIDIEKKLPFKFSNGTMKKEAIKTLVVHHEGVKTPWVYDTVKRIQKDAAFHTYVKNYGHISYHYMIDNVGDIYKCLPETEVGFHAGNLPVNKSSIAICIQGNYQEQTLNSKQKGALADFCTYMFEQRPDLPNLFRKGLKTHSEVRIGGTACPGKNVIPFVNKLKKQ